MIKDGQNGACVARCARTQNPEIRKLEGIPCDLIKRARTNKYSLLECWSNRYPASVYIALGPTPVNRLSVDASHEVCML